MLCAGSPSAASFRRPKHDLSAQAPSLDGVRKIYPVTASGVDPDGGSFRVRTILSDRKEYLFRGGGAAPPLAQLQGAQARNIENLDRFGIDAPDQTIALKFRDCPHCGFAGDAEIICQIEPVDGQAQTPAALIEKFRMSKKIEQQKRQALIGALLAENHDLSLRLTQVISDAHEQIELKLRLLHHDAEQLLPRESVKSHRRHGFRGIGITA